jgi:hypothetical protein
MPKRSAAEAVAAVRNTFALALDDSDVTVSLAKMRAKSDLPVFERLNITETLAGQFRQTISETLNRIEKEVEDGNTVLVPYNPGSNPDIHEMEFIDLAADESLREQLAPLHALAELPVFDAHGRGITTLRFYVVTIAIDGGEQLHTFRTYSHRKELSRSRSLAAVFRDGHYDSLREPIFLFDGYADCISHGDFLFILKRDNFQRIFRYLEQFKSVGKSTLETLRNRLPIGNFEQLSTECLRSPKILVKLRSLSNQDHFARLTMESVKATIREQDLEIETAGEGAEEELIFNIQRKWEFIRLLEDGYMKSEMTQTRYEVTGKRAR